MLRVALTVLTSLAAMRVAGFTAEISATVAAPTASGIPKAGQHFTLVSPAIAMVWIPPGTFLMSSPHGAGDDTDVTLTRGYWLGRTEVTQAQWQAVIESVPVPSFFKGSERPVERVAWDTVMFFCARLTERERTAGRLPRGYSYTLPTEAQWEYACRAGTTGNHGGEIDAMAWIDSNSGGQTHPVALKKPNAWGLYDMHGNVQEWCADWYRGYAGGRVNDPTGPALGQFRITRGGTWGAPAGLCRSAFRSWGAAATVSFSVGFRVALAAEPGVPDPKTQKSSGSPQKAGK